LGSILSLIIDTRTSEDSKIGFLRDNSENKSCKTNKNEHFSKALKSIFNPEFLGRIDEIIVFNELSESDVLIICKNMLEKVKSDAESLGIKLTFDPNVARQIAKADYNSEYGARPLRRIIEPKIVDVLSDKIIADELNFGNSIHIKFSKTGFTFQKNK
jgi:ATP-dependent Clp protease ATP-binding subunit ClpC